MNDARQFLRYLVPGSLFFVQMALTLMALWPDWMIEKAEFYKGTADKNALAIAIGFLVTSGAIGFLMSMIHHALYWRFPRRYGAVDYRALLRLLHRRGLISESPLPLAGSARSRPRSILRAWIILTKLWHERLKSSAKISAANGRADSMANLVHSTGACRISLGAGVLTGLLISFDLYQTSPIPEITTHLVIALSCAFAAGILLVTSHLSYRQTEFQASGFVKRVLISALSDPANWYDETHEMD